ncbi:MAG: C40 family peptidase [Streptosporangiaceae bacterium]|jgi:cell wall-associated NlpC family hydrolase
MPYRVSIIVMSIALACVAFAAGTAQAATHSVRRPLRSLAYEFALHQRGKWYCWGGAGPSCYDCSGLVSAAYRHAHIWLGRTTYDMLASGRLIRVRHPRRGDLAFYGTGHVELYDRGHYTFGAHDTGSRIGFLRFNSYWHPTAYYRVRTGRG